MRIDFHTHETVILIFGLVGLVEQEAARVLAQVAPSQLMTGSFVSLILAGVVPPAIRGAKRNGSNGQ